MCLAVPALITAIDPVTDMASVALGAVTKEVSLALVEGAAVGDYVLVHVGYALGRISPEEAERTLALIAAAGGAEVDVNSPARGVEVDVSSPAGA
ncbi:MAG TPA: HypC/HybG/HupF family hydrogenase formation chaperone [Chromatiaceae bacterium]|mgnify:FL=1|jgi:hydrogenase expression/formation protein HypC|nr:HypC/HybG/HupF family hydrogenase formation chaperone [Chromatiaceae bacterium]